MLPAALPYALGSALQVGFVPRGCPARPVVVARVPVALHNCTVVATGAPVADILAALLHPTAVFVTEYATGSLPGLVGLSGGTEPVVTCTGPSACEFPLPCGPQLHPGMTVTFCCAPGVPPPALSLAGTVAAAAEGDDLEGPPRPPVAYPVGRLVGRQPPQGAAPSRVMQLPPGVVSAVVVARPAGVHVAATVATDGPPVLWRPTPAPPGLDVVVLPLARPANAADTVTVTWLPGTPPDAVHAFMDVR